MPAIHPSRPTERRVARPIWNRSRPPEAAHITSPHPHSPRKSPHHRAVAAPKRCESGDWNEPHDVQGRGIGHFRAEQRIGEFPSQKNGRSSREKGGQGRETPRDELTQVTERGGRTSVRPPLSLEPAHPRWSVEIGVMGE